MFVHLAIHLPKPAQEAALLESMGRARDSLAGCAGLLKVTRLRDRKSGALMGLEFWESEAAWQTGVERVREAVKDDPFDEWERAAPEVYLLDDV